MSGGDPLVYQKTRQELANPAQPGGRHDQMINVALSLISGGLISEAVTVQLRSMYDSGVSDQEIKDVVSWATSKAGPPAIRQPVPTASPVKSAVQKPGKDTFERNVLDFLDGFRISLDELRNRSPWPGLEDWRFDSLIALAGLFYEDECVNILTRFTTEVCDGVLKAKPSGLGTSLPRDEWMRRIRDQGTPQSAAGAWYRFNPVDGHGVTDNNITQFRFCLLEADAIPLELQASFLAKLRLPIAMISHSGGKSLHALIRLDAQDVEQFRNFTTKLTATLKDFGFDISNKNPSRMSRLPGALREIGALDVGAQRLIYFNPDAVEPKSIS